MQHNTNLSSTKKNGAFCCCLFCCFQYLFSSDCFLSKFQKLNIPPNLKIIGILSEIISQAQKNDTWSVFCLIFINNLKGCMMNIIGGIMLGISTVYNLIINGFLVAQRNLVNHIVNQCPKFSLSITTKF
jgi:uncharacterized membrane protein SpoIIM required for sporulation